jgi:hypothetical protein
MPTLDPPAIDWGDPPDRARHVVRRHPFRVAVVTFVAALVTTVVVLLLAGAITN